MSERRRTLCVLTLFFLIPWVAYFSGGHDYRNLERKAALTQHVAYYDSQTGDFKYGFHPSQLDNICLRESEAVLKTTKKPVSSKGIEIGGRAP